MSRQDTLRTLGISRREDKAVVKGFPHKIIA